MASISEVITARVAAVVATVLPIAQVKRARERPVDVNPYANIRRGAQTHDPQSARVDMVRLSVDVCLYALGEPWETPADALAESVHAAIMADATLAGLAARVRLDGIDVNGADSPEAVGEMTLRYGINFLSRFDALNLKP